MALKKGINVRHGMQFGEPGATSASELAYDANTTTKEKIDSKQDTLTFDNVPTNGSNNPVKSDGIYDALAGKQDIFERISYADWQLLSPQQQAAKPYYIYDYPSTQITAANVSYDHTQSGLSATTAQGGIDELASEKQDATDNNLTTTDKTVVGGINEIKSGLTNIGSSTDLGNVQGSDTITLSNAVTNYRFVQILIGYYASGYPCFGQALLPVSTLFISSDDIPITVPFTDRTGTTSGKADISFLSATSAKVVNTSDAVYTKFFAIA